MYDEQELREEFESPTAPTRRQRRLGRLHVRLGAANGNIEQTVDRRLGDFAFGDRLAAKMRLGIGDTYIFSPDEIGRVLQMTSQRVQQIEAAALRRLRQTGPGTTSARRQLGSINA